MKPLLGLLFLAHGAIAATNVLVDETFKATFTDGGALANVLTCEPGYDGGFVTFDRMELKGSAIATGLGESEPFVSYLLDPADPYLKGRPRRRAFSAGCGPAFDQIAQSMVGQDVVEVEVHRRLEVYSGYEYQTRRKRNGDGLGSAMFKVDHYLESFIVKLAGHEFRMSRTLTGAAKR